MSVLLLFLPGSGGGVTHEGSVSETITLTDIAARDMIAERSVSESTTALDTLAREITIDKSFSESVALADSTERSIVSDRSVSESLPVIDTVASNVDIIASLSETIPLADLLARGLDMNVSVSESVGVQDDSTRLGTLVQTADELFIVLDTLSTSGSVWITSVAEQAMIADLMQRGIDLYGELAQAITIMDSAESTVSYDVLRDDVISFINTLIASSLLHGTMVETFTFQEVLIAGIVRKQKYSCKVCETFEPKTIKQLETDYLCSEISKNQLMEKYGKVSYSSITSHMGQHIKHWKEHFPDQSIDNPI